jgi:hypothetical protein
MPSYDWCVDLTDPTDYLTSGESNYMTIQLGVLVGIYSFCLLITLHNTFFYLLIQKRWRILLILAFYVCVFGILFFRLISLVYYMLYF